MKETEELRRRIMEVLEYDPETGLFRWKVRCRTQQKKGWFAGCLIGIKDQQYRRIKVFGVSYTAQELAWLIVTGSFAVNELDHEDQDKSNNRFSNLRDVSRTQNSRNRRMSKNNKTGFNGVSLRKDTGKFRASIRVDLRLIQLGQFDTPEEASAAREKANIEYGFHKNHGRKQ